MYTLRYMRLQDIPHVMEIDQLAFSTPWSMNSYIFEINDNRSAHMIVLEREGEPLCIVGYGGMWLIEGEAHISTIATHPNWRGQGLGEVLLGGMVLRGMRLGATYCVLEVRVSNVPAINLYRKYEFQIVSVRKGYYRDNNEDAYLMHLTPLDAAYLERFKARWQALQARVTFTDLLSLGRPSSCEHPI
ncbi:MAG: ribosomal-protein-alanine N-acetyltransferase [Candidatus Thermofonsia Clade 1 bacterium]|jgi:ribosomal-protein-alanine N-acetyltransferase|uniref:Ribosomal-protein-alanine N-acetyltransferase n=1 Tax=Candidatus Thermofonsia Clade 1 bacterium TaxID=2364210 RepID=A0A2M8NZ85_9CHLR|nr:MAG: ribosomal-protein-alanine N-acetyltransferase [Candidatus Thermofonsia Clade 1 bacterium]